MTPPARRPWPGGQLGFGLVLMMALAVAPAVHAADTPPVNTVPGGQNMVADGVKVFSSANANQISITDADAGASNNEVTLSVTTGSVTLAGITGLTFTAGDGTADATMTFRGTAAAINTALNGLSFTPPASFSGSATLTLATKDSVLLSLDIDATLKGHYRFENTGALGTDTSPAAGFTGTTSGATAVVDGTRGNVLSLAGAGYVQMTGHFGSPANVTLAAWVNLVTADTSGAEVISLGDSVSLRVDQSGVLSGAIYNGSTWTTVGYNTTLAGTGWHHVAFTFSNTANAAYLYLDGVAMSSLSTTDTISYSLGANSFIGKHGNGNTAMDFNGRIDDARIYSRVLTGAEIAVLGADLSMTDTKTVNIAVMAPPGGVQFGVGASGSANSATSITLTGFNATAGPSRVLLVGLSFGQGAPTGVSVTFNGHAFSLVAGTSGTNGNANVQIWSLFDPNAVAADIVASWTGAHDVVIGATEFANVDQTTPISNGTMATGTSTAPSVTVASATGRMTFNVVSTLGSLSAPTKTQRWLVTAPTTMDGGGSTAAGATSVIHGWTSTSAAWAAAGVSINTIATSDFKVGTFTKPTTPVAVAYQASGSIGATSRTSITLTSFASGSNTNRLLVVGLSWANLAPTSVGVTYGGVALSLAPGTSGTKGNCHVEMWYLVNPSSTASNVVASWTGTRDVELGAVAFNNVDQSTPIANGTTATGFSTTAAVAITSRTNDGTMATLCDVGSVAPSAPTQSQIWTNSGLNNLNGSGTLAPGAASVTHQWTVGTGSTNWVESGLTIRHVSGAQAIPHGLGQTPKALILWTSGNTSSTFTPGYNFGIGFTDGTTSGSATGASLDGAATSVAGRRMAMTALHVIDENRTVLAEADLASWDATNFTLDWTTSDSNAYIIHYIAISGTDVNASVVNWASPTVTGNKAVTGVGFKPTVVLHMQVGGLTAALPANSGSAGFGLGVMDFSGHQWASEMFSVTGTASGDTQRGQQTNATIFGFNSTPTASKKATFVSMDADGFTVNFSPAPAGTDQVISLALSGVNAWAGAFNKTTGASNSTQQVTGMGFLPSALFLHSAQDITRAAPVAQARTGLGASDGTDEASSAGTDQDMAATTRVKSIDKSTKAFVKVNNDTSTIDAEANVNSLDPDGFTLKWTTNDAVATEMLYLAFGPLINTDVRLIAANATRYPRGTLLQWTTGYEINNLGFNLYRDRAGVRTQVNTTLIAGSGLQAGQGFGVVGERLYARWDLDPASSDPAVTYWLEDVEFNGQRKAHGPIVPVAGQLQEPATVDSTELGEVGLDAAANSRRIFYNYNEDPVHPGPRAVPAQVEPQVTRQWALAARATVKMGIRKPGWYRVTQPELVRAGFGPGIDPRALQVFLDGTEQAIRVIGEGDGIFGSTDAIEFYASGIETPYSDTRVYWLQAGDGPGLRIGIGAVQAFPPSAATGFMSTLRRKDRSVYAAAIRNGDVENWFGPVVGTASLDDPQPPATLLTLTPSNIDGSSAGSAQLLVALQGLTTTADGTVNHRVGVLFNGTNVGEMTFSGQAHAEETFSVAVRAGENTVALEARGGDVRDADLVDVIRLDYPHTYQADADRLRFTVEAPGSITVGGFAGTSIRVFDITDRAVPLELPTTLGANAGMSTVTVTVPGTGLRTLFAFSDETVGSPAFVEANRPSTWNAPGQVHDYVIISHPDFIAQAGPLAALRQQQGHTPAIIDVNDLYDEFSFGEKTPQAIKDFLQWVRTNWQQAPRFVVLLGDATIDPRDYWGLGDADFVPTKNVSMDGVALETASDDWFVDFANSGLPDVPIGRLSVRTAAQAATMVAKIVSYEQAPAQAWTKNVLLVAGETDGMSTFGQFSATLASLVPHDYTVKQVVTDDLGSQGARQAILDRVNNDGELIVNYAGHGSVQLWGKSAPFLMSNDDVTASWTNAARLPFVVAMNCLNGFFNGIWDEESLAEALQRAPQGGAVAVWASSSTTPPASQALVNQELFRLIFQATYGTLGEAIVAAKRVAPNSDVRRSWVFFGDPAMHLSGAPRPAPGGVVTPPPPVVNGGGGAPPASEVDKPVLVANNQSALRLADWNADGRADVWVSTGVSWRLVLSAAAGARVVAGAWARVWEAYPANLNGDAAADLVLFDRLTGAWVQGINDGALNFAYTSGLWGAEWTVNIADVDGDGFDDVVLTDSRTGFWKSGLNDQVGGFVYHTGQWPIDSTVTMGDFTGDGRADAFLYNPNTGAWQLAASDGMGGFTVSRTGRWASGWTVQPAHLNDDKQANLLLYNPDTGAWAASSVDQTGAFTLLGGFWERELTVRALDAAPGSHNPDEVLLYNPETGQAVVLANPVGLTTAEHAWWLPGRLIATGDVDGDGRTDVVLFDPVTGAWNAIIRPPQPVSSPVDTTAAPPLASPLVAAAPVLPAVATPSSNPASSAISPPLTVVAARPMFAGGAVSFSPYPSSSIVTPASGVTTAILASSFDGSSLPSAALSSIGGFAMPSPAAASGQPGSAVAPAGSRPGGASARPEGQSPSGDETSPVSPSPQEPDVPSPPATTEVSGGPDTKDSADGTSLAFLGRLRVGQSGAPTLFGGSLTGTITRVTVAVTQVTSAMSSRLDVRLRGQHQADSHVTVLINGVRVGEIASDDQDHASPSLVVPTGLIIQGDNFLTFIERSAAPSESLH